MKSSNSLLKMAVCTAITASSSGIVHAGMSYDQGYSSSIQSSRSSADVRAELDRARVSGNLLNGDGDLRSEADALGPRGSAGARFSSKTREDVNNELFDDQGSNRTAPLGG